MNAIERDEIAPLFQPIVDLRSGLVAGYEALSRFMRGSRDVSSWFAEAHTVGMGLRLEAHAASLPMRVPRRPFGAFIAINVSPTALLSTEFQRSLPDRLDGILLELTGHGPKPPDDQLRAACSDVRDRGGRLAVDLAGSDYTGLRELMMAGPDMLKLDRSLVHRVHLDKAKEALVGSLVGYARELGITVCGEAVETLEDLERLAELDVTYGQGYALARPARPWVGVDPEAARLLQSSTAASVTGSTRLDDLRGDGRLQWLAWRLSEATSFEELAEAVGAIQAELAADEISISMVDGEDLVSVGRAGMEREQQRFRIAEYPLTARLLRDQDSAQVFINDPEADQTEVDLLRELGHKSLLMLPVCCAGAAIGLFEAYSSSGRAFSRFEIGRARVIALQLGATLERISRG
ncbi:MAG: hypothetical protein QOF76_3140 [Solirubrobacteraceae bacterium]|nr:hypothetical protein [Solirubrobacteraceae bacterium]